MRHSMAQPRARIRRCAKRSPLARGDGDLLGDEVDAGDHLGHRMLHLDARIHLEEVELVARDIDQELHRARAAILQPRGEAQRRLVQTRAQLRATEPGAGVSSMSFW